MLTIQSVQNLQWANESKTTFSCLVKYAEFNDFHPTGVNSLDSYSHIQELWAEGVAGKYGVIADYVAPIAEEMPVSAQPTTTGTQTL